MVFLKISLLKWTNVTDIFISKYKLFKGNIKVGCIETPLRGSFFCEIHKSIDNKQAFRYRNTTILFDLNIIKPKIGKIKNENLIIYDSFINQNDVLLLLVNYSNLVSDPFWVTSVQIQASKVDNYIDQLKNFQKSDNLCTVYTSL